MIGFIDDHRTAYVSDSAEAPCEGDFAVMEIGYGRNADFGSRARPR
jgi:hypothetical protein